MRSVSSLVCGLLAVCALGIGAWAGAQFRSAVHGRPWFVNPQALARGADGALLVAVDDREIHAYSASGEPLAAWRVGDPDAPALPPDAGRELLGDEGRWELTDAGLVRRAPAPERVLVPLPPAPLAWFGTRPLLPVTGVLLLVPVGLAACLALRPRPPAA